MANCRFCDFTGIYILGVAYLFLTFLNLGADARIIKLDLKSDKDSNSEFWSTISCAYKEDYEAYNKTCLKAISPEESAFENRNGFWSTCGLPTCELIYYGGYLPQPESIKVNGLVGGNGRIRVQGKRSLIGNKFDYDLAEFNGGTASEFEEKLVLQSIFKQCYAFRFQLIANDLKSVAVLDSIEIDLGTSAPDPMTPAIETTPTPGSQLDFLLDTESDIKPEWTEISCNYQDLAEDLWIWGCPSEAKGIAGKYGYWAPCASHSCDFVFRSQHYENYPETITIKGDLGKGSRITISHTSKRLGLGSHSEEIISEEIKEPTDSWTYTLKYYYSEELYNVTVTSVNGSPMVIDSASVHLSDDLAEATTVTDVDDTTIAATVTATDPLTSTPVTAENDTPAPTTETDAIPTVTPLPSESTTSNDDTIRSTTDGAHTLSSYIILTILATLSTMAITF